MTPEEQAELDKLKADIEQANADNAGLKNQLEEKTAEISELKGQLQSATEAKEESEKKFIDAQSELNLLKSAPVNEETASLKQQLEDFKIANVNLTSQVETLSKQAGQWGIKNLEEAQAHVKEKYKVPATVKRIMVTQDGNVFYDNDLNSGAVHAKDLGLLNFTFHNIQ